MYSRREPPTQLYDPSKKNPAAMSATVMSGEKKRANNPNWGVCTATGTYMAIDGLVYRATNWIGNADNQDRNP
jgi:hypothetical protein